jgi:transposase-like protein
MHQLPRIERVDNVTAFNQMIYESNEKSRKNKILAYLNQIGLIDYNKDWRCARGHKLEIKPANNSDGWWWRCNAKGCQKSKSIRTGTFFFENRIKLWEVLLIIFNFAFEFLNTTTNQLVGVSSNTIMHYKRRLRLIILSQLQKQNIKLGGVGKVVEIDESLFVKVKHNRGRDMAGPKIWVFGMYERPTANQPKKVLFFQVDSRDAVTLLNIIYNHVLPGTTIHSDCWASYNQINNLGRQYNHRTVNHSLTFVAPDGTHTNSIESTWKSAKRQFKQMNGVSRLYLQSYLDEYCWRLSHGNLNGWTVYESLLRAIKDFYSTHPDANDILDRSIYEEDHNINQEIDDNLNFEYNNVPDVTEPLALGDINKLILIR